MNGVGKVNPLNGIKSYKASHLFNSKALQIQIKYFSGGAYVEDKGDKNDLYRN